MGVQDMSARIYQFPDKHARYFNGYKISLYNEEEVFITILSMNTFGPFKEKITEANLENYDPVDIIRALSEARKSSFLTNRTKHIILKILKSVEPV